MRASVETDARIAVGTAHGSQRTRRLPAIRSTPGWNCARLPSAQRRIRIIDPIPLVRATVKYCSSCGQSVGRRIPNGDNRERFVCDACGTIHYQNPKVVTGCLPVYGDRVLLCRRAIQPRAGLWTLPAGFLENGETSSDGAIRETLEEACANVSIEGLYAVFNLPHISQIYMFFRASLLDLDFKPGFESTDVRLFERTRDSLGRTRISGGSRHPAALLQRPLQRHLPGAGRRHPVRSQEVLAVLVSRAPLARCGTA